MTFSDDVYWSNASTTFAERVEVSTNSNPVQSDNSEAIRALLIKIQHDANEIMQLLKSPILGSEYE